MYKLTLDGGLMRDYVVVPAVATLKNWQMEGKVEIFETDRADAGSTVNVGWPGGTPDPANRTNRRRSPQKKDPKAAADYGRIAALLFPMRDVRRLNMAELNDINHLQRHLNLGRTIFVTRNNPSFIDGGKREKLQAAFQILVMTPDEVVEYLCEKEGWTVKKSSL